MKRAKALLASIVLFSSLSYGQIGKDTFEQAVDRLNCNSVFYSLSVLSPTEGVTKGFANSCNCKSNPGFEKIKNSLPDTESYTIKLSNEIEGLKDSYDPQLTGQEVVKLLTEKAFDKNELLKDFKEELISKGKYADYYRILEKELQDILIDNVQIVNRADLDEARKLSDLEGRVLALEKSRSLEPDKGFLGDTSDYLVLLALLLSVIGIGLIIILGSRNGYESVMARILDSHRLKDFVQSNSVTGNNRNLDNSSDMKDIHSRIRDLEAQLNNLSRSTEKLGESQKVEPKLHSHHMPQQSDLKSEILYLSTPNFDGSFNASSASPVYKEGASIYRFMKTESGRAKFKIDEKEASVRLALQYPDKSIDPVCDAVNAFNPKASGIRTAKEGEVELHGGKWITSSKAKIFYED